MNRTKRITIGILAHVDAGKTTLSEAILAESGYLRRAGRVDHGDTFFDTDEQERARGITIFSSQAVFHAGETEVFLVDTPGHTDLSAEMERTLAVLDYAVLVVSGKELIQGHTLTIWRLLQRHAIPVFVFVNKMDLDGTDEEKAMQALRASLDANCVRFSGAAGQTADGLSGAAGETEDAPYPDPEELAVCDEHLLDSFLAGEELQDSAIASAVSRRKVFPCYFGAALKQRGVGSLLDGLDRFTRNAPAGKEFAARVFRITRDSKGERLTHLKILGGSLRVREPLITSEDGEEEKIHQIRICSGESYETADAAEPGMLAAVTGPSRTFAGQGLGSLLGQNTQAVLQPALTWKMILPEDVSVPLAMQQLRELEEEDPQIHIRWNEKLQEIQVRLMGEIQLEILRNLITQRYGFSPRFDEGKIEYRETILRPVRGAGHFEPLRHYAEVHLLLEPLPEGSGLEFASSCSSDELDTNWQRLILTHLKEREHPGVLTGSPVTDMRITIEGGRAHPKHTEGGDFRQATYRALRQALRKAECRLLEPWYEFTLELPRAQAGRAMADIQRMSGILRIDESSGGDQETAFLQGRAPVSEMRGYGAEAASYTRGYGHLSCTFGGFFPCHREEEAILESGYDPDSDPDNPADSIFCTHGAGRSVPWNIADEYMHVDVRKEREEAGPRETEFRTGYGGKSSSSAAVSDKELARIFERTYGTPKEKKPTSPARVIESEEFRRRPKQASPRTENLQEYLLVDGYNIIFAWEELRELSKTSIDAAREALISILSNYQGYRGCEVIVVFDAYRVKGGVRHTERFGNVTVVFTGEAETADTYIERTTYEIGKKYHVRVATSDRLEQMIILGNNAFRVPADEFRTEVEQVDEQIRSELEQAVRENRRDWKNGINLPLHTE